MKKLSLTLATIFLLGVQNQVFAETAFERGVSNYNAGRYKHAVVFLTQAASLDPTNSLCHYYLANTLTRLNQLQDALLEYQICKRLEPNGPVAKYCKQAVEALSGRSREAQHLADASENITPSESSSAHPARHSSNAAVNRAMYVIKREVEWEKGKHKMQAELGSKAALAMAEESAKQIKRQADADIQRAISDSWVTVPTVQGFSLVNNYVLNQELARIRTNEIKRNAEEAEQRARRVSEIRVAEFNKLASEKQRVLDEVAVNLKSQMELPAGRSGVRLQPLGTDLYVRYYGRSSKAAKYNNGKPFGLSSNMDLKGTRAAGNFVGDDGGAGNAKIIKSVRGKVLH